MNTYDVIIAGGGNAGLCAAVAAAKHANKVLLVERAPEELRGGNSKYTRDIRCGSKQRTLSSLQYSEEEFLDDLLKVTGGVTNIELATLTIRKSFEIPKWMEENGIKWQRPIAGTLHLARTNRFFIGGGKALVNSYYEHVKKLGVQVLYNSVVEDLLIENGEFKSAIANVGGRELTLEGRSLIVASGGFEANIPWLREYWGEAANKFIIRGTRYNDGILLKTLMSKGAMITGNPKQFHAVGVDARSQNFDGGIVTRVDSLPFGIVVNKFGERFYDEGEDLWPKRYAVWGKLIAEQPDQIAYSIFDSNSTGKFIPPLYEPYKANTLFDLARILDLDPHILVKSVGTYNDHVATGSFDPTRLDDCKTVGLDPPKSHWALRLDNPPFYAYPLRPGITFTYMGVTVDRTARVLSRDGVPFQNVYAAGEIMAGNILTRGYLAGFGLTIGTVFGRIAGEEASRND